MYCGTPSYIYPELCSKTEYDGKKNDIWSLGILLFVMLTRVFPFKRYIFPCNIIDKDDKELFKKINKGELIFPYETKLDVQNLIIKMLK